MKKSVFWVLLLVGLTISILLSRIPEFIKERTFNNYWIPVASMLVGIFMVFCAGKFRGFGHPKIYLPAGKNFRKISEFRGKDNIVFLTLKHVKDKVVFIDPQNGDNILHNNIRLYKICVDILLDKDGHEIKEIPEEFDVKISRRIVPGQGFEKHPNLEKVYYIIPSSKTKTKT